MAFRGDDVGAHFARRFHKSERHNFCDDGDQERALVMRRLGDRFEIVERAEDVRRLHDDAGGVVVDEIDDLCVGVDGGGHVGDGDVEMLGERLGRFGVVRMQAGREHRLFPPRHARRHEHRFRAGRRAVVHGGVGDLHAGEHRDLGLKLEQGLQRALRDLRLVRRVRGQEFRALNEMVDGRRNVVAVGAGAAEELGCVCQPPCCVFAMPAQR